MVGSAALVKGVLGLGGARSKARGPRGLSTVSGKQAGQPPALPSPGWGFLAPEMNKDFLKMESSSVPWQPRTCVTSNQSVSMFW